MKVERGGGGLRRVIVGIGELLWDLLPSGPRLGGAPANFAYIASVLGASSAVVSCVGNDDLGREARRMLNEHGLDIRHIQVDAEHPTGSVEVTLSGDGTPRYSILENVAWDHVQWTSDLAQLAAVTDAVCFGTLAQRSALTRKTIHEFLDHTPSPCLRILDVNCRPPFCTPEILQNSLAKANVLKLSSEELAMVLEAASMHAMHEVDAAVALQRKYKFKSVCITLGPQGSVIVADGSAEICPGFKVEVADTVGAGDAFGAAMALGLLNGLKLKTVSDAANSVAAWVASQHGAMPAPDHSERVRLRQLVS
jgi:fructokinase